MPIFLIILLTASVLNPSWPPSLVGHSPVGTVLATFALVLVPVGLSWMHSLRVWQSRRESPERRSQAERWYRRWRGLAAFVNLGAAALAVFCFGWGRLVHESAIAPWNGRLFPLAELLVPLPYFAAAMNQWLAYWFAERAFHSNREGDKPFWTALGYWLFQARQFVLLLVLPVLLTAAYNSLVRHLPLTSRTWWFQLLVSICPLVLLVGFPIAMKLLLGWKKLPAGPLRDRFVADAARLRCRISDIYVMPTQRTMANAMVVGVVPWARYVVFTDYLLEAMPPDELLAVYGHELGHVRHRHVLLYFAFLMMSGLAISSALLIALQVLETHFGSEMLDRWPRATIPLLALGLMGLNIFVVFGWLSRACERQADLFGARANSCIDRDCCRHDETTALHESGLCRSGLRAMAKSLERVMHMNGMEGIEQGRFRTLKRIWAWMQSWQHGPILHRVHFLLSAIDDPTRDARHQRRVRWMWIATFAVLVLIIECGVWFAGAGFKQLLELDELLF